MSSSISSSMSPSCRREDVTAKKRECDSSYFTFFFLHRATFPLSFPRFPFFTGDATRLFPGPHISVCGSLAADSPRPHETRFRGSFTLTRPYGIAGRNRLAFSRVVTRESGIQSLENAPIEARSRATANSSALPSGSFALPSGSGGESLLPREIADLATASSPTYAAHLNIAHIRRVDSCGTNGIPSTRANLAHEWNKKMHATKIARLRGNGKTMAI